MATPLKKARLLNGISTNDLARRVNVQPPTINRIENGKKRPSPELTIRLAEEFAAILTRDQIMFPEFYTDKKKPVRRVTLQEAHA